MGELHLHGQGPRDVGRIVDEQIRRWTLAQRSGAWGETHWPVVTISREFGSRGAEVGRRVAERLGFCAWDREIVTLIAERLHTGEADIAQLDEHARGAVEELLSSTLFGDTTTSPDYCDQLCDLVRTIQRRGGAVIIGRGAHCIVDARRALRVRMVASLGARAQHYAERNQLSPEDALRAVRAADRDRAEFVRRAFGTDVAEPTNYDLIINSEVFEPERAEGLIVMAYLTKFGELPSQRFEPLAASP